MDDKETRARLNLVKESFNGLVKEIDGTKIAATPPDELDKITLIIQGLCLNHPLTGICLTLAGLADDGIKMVTEAVKIGVWIGQNRENSINL